MINLNKNIILIGFILFIILIVACKVQVRQPVSAPPASTVKETAPAEASTPNLPSTNVSPPAATKKNNEDPGIS